MGRMHEEFTGATEAVKKARGRGARIIRDRDAKKRKLAEAVAAGHIGKVQAKEMSRELDRQAAAALEGLDATYTHGATLISQRAKTLTKAYLL